MGVIILTGKSCSGKDSVRRELEGCNFINIVSYTSRPMRVNELDGVDYHFISRDKFEQMINDNQMVEYRTYNTLVDNIPNKWYYGFKKEELKFNEDYIVILDLEGVENFIKHYGRENCFIVYMCCPKPERKRRAIERGSFNNAEWNRRLIADDKDFKAKKLEKLVDFTVVNMSDEIEDVPKIAKILRRMYNKRFNKEG